MTRAGRTEAEAATLVDPKLSLKPGTGPTVRVRVLKNMTYLDGKFHDAGAVVTVGRVEAEAAVADGSATGEA